MATRDKRCDKREDKQRDMRGKWWANIKGTSATVPRPAGFGSEV